MLDIIILNEKHTSSLKSLKTTYAINNAFNSNLLKFDYVVNPQKPHAF